MSEDEVVLNERCCFGRLSAFTCLPLIAGLNLFVDVGVACLSIGSDFVYLFGIVSVFSILCLAAVVSGIQEEQSGKIKLSIAWTLIKMVSIVILTAGLILAVIDFDWFTELTRLNLNFKLCLLLLALLPVEFVLSILQFVWSKQMLEIIAIRDQLYVIPSETGPVSMRTSLRLHLNNLKDTQLSISTILPVEKY